MGNRRARDVREREDMREIKRRAQEGARLLHEDVGWPGAGARALQVVHQPSFDPGFAWEIRKPVGEFIEANPMWELPKPEGEFAVYRSSAEHVWGLGTLLRGYSQLAVSSDKLESYWEAVRSVAVDLSPLYNGMGGLDGVRFQLALFGDMYSSVRFTWWSTYPPNWEPLDRIAREMIDTFRGAAEIEDP